MAEVTSNVEFAQKIHEHGHRTSGPSSGMEAWFEIVEVALLAIVAVMTAWSSYQAARWDALSAKSYAMATRTTVVAQEKTTLAGHERIYDMMGAQAWANAKLSGDTKMAAFYQRRFRAEYRVAFEAGVENRETGDSYVRVTVLLATVLLLTALAQRLKLTGPRLALLAIAFIMLAISSYSIFVYPRA